MRHNFSKKKTDDQVDDFVIHLLLWSGIPRSRENCRNRSFSGELDQQISAGIEAATGGVL